MRSAEKRKYERFDQAVKINFTYSYDFETKVKFQEIDQNDEVKDQIHTAISKNVSCNGIAFVSDVELKPGAYLAMEVFVPRDTEAIKMVGEVRWSKRLDLKFNDIVQYETGVQLSEVNGEKVDNSIFIDQEYHVAWSNVLESVLGKYRIIAQDKKNNEDG